MSEAEKHSRAWQLGWDAGMDGSSRKPPKKASDTWKQEFEAGRTAAREAYKSWQQRRTDDSLARAQKREAAGS